MALFNIGKKDVRKAAPAKTVSDMELQTWYIHREDIQQLAKDLGIDAGSTFKEYLKAKIVPDPGNKADKNALKVMAGKRGRGNGYYFVGFIPAAETDLVRECQKAVDDGTHYWSVAIEYDILDGTRFYISLRESQYKK